MARKNSNTFFLSPISTGLSMVRLASCLRFGKLHSMSIGRLIVALADSPASARNDWRMDWGKNGSKGKDHTRLQARLENHSNKTSRGICAHQGRSPAASVAGLSRRDHPPVRFAGLALGVVENCGGDLRVPVLVAQPPVPPDPAVARPRAQSSDRPEPAYTPPKRKAWQPARPPARSASAPTKREASTPSDPAEIPSVLPIFPDQRELVPVPIPKPIRNPLRRFPLRRLPLLGFLLIAVLVLTTSAHIKNIHSKIGPRNKMDR